MPSVNRPTNVQQKTADVNQKLQLYGIYSAFANGKVPSNRQIDVALNSAIASRPLANPSNKLSEEGRALVQDLRDVIEQAKVLLLTKNQGNLLQDFIYQTSQVSGGATALPNAPVDKTTAQQHGNQALDGLRTLGTLLLSNGQFRKLLSDSTILLRDIAGDAAQTAAHHINPSEERLSSIDQPADDNTWHEVPNMSAGNMKAQARDQFNKNKPFSKGDVQNATNNAGSAYQDPNVDNRGAGSNIASNLQSQASANVPESTKQTGRDMAHKTKGYVNEKIPQERRDQTIYRLKKMIVEIQGHSDYQEAVETLLSLAEQYGGHSKNLTQQGAGTVKGFMSENQNMLISLKTLLERFANSTSADDLIEAINNLYRDADRDPELKGWFRSLDAYIRKCLKQTGFIMQDSATTEWEQLQRKGDFLLRERYRDHTNRVLDEFKFFGLQFDEDPMNHRFANSVNKLFLDLGNDQNGQPTFKKHLVTDLSQVIVPGIFESVRYVPVPRIEYSDPMIDAIIENLVIESDNLAPNSFEFGSDNYFRWGRKTVTNKNKNKVMVSVSGVQMDLRDVSYYIKKKTGFPSITDTGVMDIFMGGNGFSFKIAMETADKTDRAHFFKINKVDVDIKSLTIKLKQSKHKLLFNVFRPLMFAILRPAVGKVLEKLITDQVRMADAKAYEIHQEAERAAEAVRNDPQNAPNIYSRYTTAAQKVMTQKKKKAEAVASDKKANVAVTQTDSLFPQIKLPGGISSKATEYKALAAKGDKWESPVFGIGSSAESTNLPTLTPVSRKQHSTASGGVRGAQNLQSGQSTLGQAQPRTQGIQGTQQQSYPSQQQSYSTQQPSSYSNSQQSYPAGQQSQSATTGLSNEMNQAFSSAPSGAYALDSNSAPPNGGYASGYSTGMEGTGVGGASSGVGGVSGNSETVHTTLGKQNPVLSGMS